MTYFNQRASFEAIRSLGFAGISGTYANVGTPTDEPAREIILSNITDSPLMVSFDGGSTDHIALAANTVLPLPLTNLNVGRSPLQLPVNSQIAIKEITTSPTVGSFYVTVIYAAAQ